MPQLFHVNQNIYKFQLDKISATYNFMKGRGVLLSCPAPGGHPASFAKKIWIPAFAGMTGLQEKLSEFR